MQAMGQMLEMNRTLTRVDITVNLSASLVPIAESLAKNAALQSVNVHLKLSDPAQYMSFEDVMEEVQAFEEMLQFRNQTLTDLHFSTSMDDMSGPVGFHTWRTLVPRWCQWHVHSERMSETAICGQKEHKEKSGCFYGKLGKLDFYLKLNRLGRRFLVGPTNTSRRDAWITIIAHQSDVSVVFYFLQSNPSIYFDHPLR